MNSATTFQFMSFIISARKLGEFSKENNFENVHEDFREDSKLKIGNFIFKAKKLAMTLESTKKNQRMQRKRRRSEMPQILYSQKYPTSIR